MWQVQKDMVDCPKMKSFYMGTGHGYTDSTSEVKGGEYLHMKANRGSFYPSPAGFREAELQGIFGDMSYVQEEIMYHTYRSQRMEHASTEDRRVPELEIWQVVRAKWLAAGIRASKLYLGWKQ